MPKKKLRITRSSQQNRDYGAPLRGWFTAVVHVRVDGMIKSGRVEGNVAYVWQPGGWGWEQVLLFLGNGTSGDFATKKMV